MMMRMALPVILMAPLLGLTQTPSSGGETTVALAPFVVVSDSAGTLRATANDCLEHLASALKARGITVARHESLTDKTISRARPAALAVLGEFRKEKGIIQVALRLMDVSTGDELRSYFHGSADPREIASMGTAVADRIVKYMREKSG